MDRSSKHFINREMLAPNVLEIDVDLGVIASLADMASRLQQLGPVEGMVENGEGVQLCAIHASWDSDILWISQADRQGYDYFENIFQRLRIAENVAQHVMHDREIVMYSGFFVTRSRCYQPDFHCDWIGCNNDAFTYLGPVSDNCSELGLTYRNLRNQKESYDYRPGKGLVFGDFFNHSTAPGQASGTTVLLSFTFGTDRMENWPKIAKTAAAQGMFYRQPDGQFITRDRAPAGY